LARAFFNEKSKSLPARLALAVNEGAADPIDNMVDWAKPDWVIKSEKLKSRTDR
jgi:hypothetical protein